MSLAQGPSASWDVFHAESLELERGLSTSAVRAALAGGALRDDDLVRPAGTAAAWTRLADIPELSAHDNSPPGVPETSTSARAEAGPPEPNPEAIPRRVTRGEQPKASPTQPSRADFTGTGAETSDFELEADDGISPLSTTTAPETPRPTWLQLGGEPNDVTFPVLRDQPVEPKRPERGHPESEATSATAWTWGNVDDEDQEDEPLEAELDDQIEILDDDPAAGLEILDEDGLAVPSPFSADAYTGGSGSRMSLPVVPSRDWNEDRQPVEGGEEEGDFTLSRSGPMTVEELDLAPMVDVAFQLVLFFMVTATTVLFKTLEIPKPSSDPPPGAVAQGQSRSLEDFKDDYVLVEIDASGNMKIDHEPVPAELNALAERLRTSREKTGRKAMLLSADFATPHRHAVLAYDAANEIGMGIAIAKPSPPQGVGPGLLSGSGRAAQNTRVAAPSTAPVSRTAPTPTTPAPGGPAPFD
ncbi:MAG: ExbD/TolR family protein [Isosphaeraceae bacterium]